MNVVFTFDDGFIDGIAWMSCFRLPATFFVSPGLVGNNACPLYTIGGYEKEFRMTWDHLRKIIELRGEAGCHGWLHERYDQIDKESALTFLRHCDDEFGRWIVKRPECFAFPDHKAGHVDLVKQFYKCIRQIPGTAKAMFLRQKDTSVYVWHKATDPDELYGTTEGLIKAQAKFITLGEACRTDLIETL